METYQLSERHVCRLIGLARSTKRYRSRGGDRNAELRELLCRLAEQRPRFGYRRLHALVRREGVKANHKRVYRIYHEEGLAMRRRRKRKWVRMGATVAAVPTRANERWSMDFVSDCLANGQTFRALVVVDDYTRELLAVEVDTSISGLRVRRVLESVVIERGRPGGIVVDNGREFRARVMEAWSEQRRVPLQFIEPGRPMQNAFVESFHGRLRDECLNSHWFLDLGDARRKIRAWVKDYNEQRPHSSLGYLTPSEFAATARVS